jgi:hypothetical protein
MPDLQSSVGYEMTSSSRTDAVVVAEESNEHAKVLVIVRDFFSSNTMQFSFDDLPNGLMLLMYAQKNESLLIGAIRNFIRKMNFDELNESLRDAEITIEQYQKELRENKDKYAITLYDVTDKEEVLHIIRLMNRIGHDLREFTTSEVAEMFSVKESQLVCIANKLRPILNP